MKKSHIISTVIVILGVILGWTSTVAATESVARDTPARNAESQRDSGPSANSFIKTSLNTTSQRFRRGKLTADHILVEKTKRKLTLFSDGQVLKQYKISLGRNPVGTKIRAGDNRTPEGLYYIDYRIEDSDYHMALHISYPSKSDVRRARQQGYSPGGSIMLHGLKNNDDEIAYYHGYFDWTKGCIAVNNTEIEEIWRLVPNGTSIEIRP
jgi:murein L,D-transpeptidase YafK